MWQFAISSGLPYLYGKIGDYVILYGDKDKNTMQGNLAELVGWKTVEAGIYEGVASGSEGNTYTGHIDTGYLGKSFCNCLFAYGRRVVCRHMIPLYFTVESKAVKDFLKEVEKWEDEVEE